MRKALGRYRLARRGGPFGAVAAITVLVASVSAMAVTPASAAVQHTAEHATAGHTAAVPAAAAPHGLTAWRSRHKLRLPDPKPRRHPKPHPAPLGRPGGVPVGDEAITASSDTSGYHVFAAASGDGWRWHALATLQPAGYRDQAWIGQQCLTGDGRYVVAVVAPWGAQNSAAGIAAGGLAYAIDAHTGAVRPLAAGLALTYFDPGCGTGSTAALTRYGSADQSRTQILAVNAATGAVTATPVIANQVTSAVT